MTVLDIPAILVSCLSLDPQTFCRLLQVSKTVRSRLQQCVSGIPSVQWLEKNAYCLASLSYGSKATYVLPMESSTVFKEQAVAMSVDDIINALGLAVQHGQQLLPLQSFTYHPQASIQSVAAVGKRLGDLLAPGCLKELRFSSPIATSYWGTVPHAVSIDMGKSAFSSLSKLHVAVGWKYCPSWGNLLPIPLQLKSLHCLTFLSLDGCWSNMLPPHIKQLRVAVKDKDAFACVQQLSGLTELELYCHGVSGMVGSLTQLRSISSLSRFVLDVRDYTWSFTDLSNLCTSMTCLQEVRISHCSNLPITYELALNLASYLTSLSIECIDVEAKWVQALSKLTNLQHLGLFTGEVADSHEHQAALADVLGALPSLRSLAITVDREPEEEVLLTAIGRLSRLTGLELQVKDLYVESISDMEYHLGDASLSRVLRQLTQLQSLKLSGAVPPIMAPLVGGMQHLTYLQLPIHMTDFSEANIPWADRIEYQHVWGQTVRSLRNMLSPGLFIVDEHSCDIIPL